MGAMQSNDTSNGNETDYDDDWDFDFDDDESEDCSLDELQMMSFYLLIPAIILIIIFMFMEVRKKLYLSCCGGHFAIVEPLNLIENRSNRLPYIAVFSLTSLSAATVFIKNSSELMGINATNHFQSVFLKQLYIVIICLIFFPIFASCSAKNLITLLLGIGYSISFMAVRTYEIFSKLMHNSCDLSALNPPDMVALCLFLIITYCSGSCFIYYQLKRISFRVSERKIKNRIRLQEIEIKDYARKYTEHLLTCARKSENIRKGRSKIVAKVVQKIHPNIPGFRYSLSILSSMAIALTVIFFFSILWITRLFYTWLEFSEFIDVVLEDFKETKSAPTIFLWIANKLLLKGKGQIDDTFTISITEFFQDQCTIIFMSGISALVLAFLSVSCICCHMLKTYRHDVKNLYKSDAVARKLASTNHVTLVVNANKFVGYQIAYFFWGFFLQYGFLWLILIIVGEIFIFPLVYGMWGYLRGFFDTFGPVIVMMYITYGIQYFLVKFLFVQERGKYLALDNRRGFMNLMYFFLFYNMFIGLFSCLKRILRSLVCGLLFIPRLDKSIMPKTFERYDPGYKAYICLLKLEVLQTNPVIMTFLTELYNDSEKRRRIRESLSSEAWIVYKKKMIARTRWFLAWTLIFNPCLQIERWSRERVLSKLELQVLPTHDEPEVFVVPTPKEPEQCTTNLKKDEQNVPTDI